MKTHVWHTLTILKHTIQSDDSSLHPYILIHHSVHWSRKKIVISITTICMCKWNSLLHPRRNLRAGNVWLATVGSLSLSSGNLALTSVQEMHTLPVALLQHTWSVAQAVAFWHSSSLSPESYDHLFKEKKMVFSVPLHRNRKWRYSKYHWSSSCFGMTLIYFVSFCLPVACQTLIVFKEHHWGSNEEGILRISDQIIVCILEKDFNKHKNVWRRTLTV